MGCRLVARSPTANGVGATGWSPLLSRDVVLLDLVLEGTDANAQNSGRFAAVAREALEGLADEFGFDLLEGRAEGH